MHINIARAQFAGYGTKIKNDYVYICQKIDYVNKTGIRLYDLDKGTHMDLFFSDDHFYGNVLCINLYGIDLRNTGYCIIADEKMYVDPYAQKLDKDKTVGYFVSSKPYKAFENDKQLLIPYSESCFYLTSVKGQTMLDGMVKANKGTFKALEKKVQYFNNLSITGLVLMPLYELHPDKNTNYRNKSAQPNYWGFGDGYHFAIKQEYIVEDGDYEFKHFVKTYHDAGIEIIPIMQFAEGTCMDYIVSALAYWVMEYHVDGFRLVGCDCFEELLHNPLFSKTKLISDACDFGHYKNEFPGYKNAASVKTEFLEKARSFAKSDEDMVPYFSYAVRENSKNYAPVRFISDFSGFTLYDCVSYNEKHNEANNEENTDGTDYNHSWNCGCEGDTNKKSVIKLRNRQARNLLLLAFLCQGTPMLRGGDEWLNTQYGNNNPYCQDNETGWVKFIKDKNRKDFYLFVKNLLAFRKRHVILHQPKELMMFDYMSAGLPDVSYHGKEAYKMDNSPVSKCFAVLYHGDYAKQYSGKKEESLFIIYNMDWEDREIAIPVKKDNRKCRVIYSSDGSTSETFNEKDSVPYLEDTYYAKGRSVTILSL